MNACRTQSPAVTGAPAARGGVRTRRGVTLLEILVVVAIIAIASAIVLPDLSSSSASRLRAAADLLNADIQFAQADSIAHGDDPRVIGLSADGTSYWIAPSSNPDSPIRHPIDRGEYRNTFGEGRCSALAGITIEAVGVGGDGRLGFGALGQLDQPAAASIRVRCGKALLTLEIDPATGEVTVR